MKVLKYITALTLINFVIIAVIGFTTTPPVNKQIKSKFGIPPTPIVVVKKVIITPTPQVGSTNNTVTKTSAPKTNAPQATQTVVATQAPKVSGCIITVDGASYNVTNLRMTHSGGDIFVCGSDMSQEFWGRHNQKIFQILQQYRI